MRVGVTVGTMHPKQGVPSLRYYSSASTDGDIKYLYKRPGFWRETVNYSAEITRRLSR